MSYNTSICKIFFNIAYFAHFAYLTSYVYILCRTELSWTPCDFIGRLPLVSVGATGAIPFAMRRESADFPGLGALADCQLGGSTPDQIPKHPVHKINHFKKIK